MKAGKALTEIPRFNIVKIITNVINNALSIEHEILKTDIIQSEIRISYLNACKIHGADTIRVELARLYTLEELLIDA
jgi:hypothetical protein